ncbi:hypothetical protein QWJ41_04190 [Nocardioides sp. SOB44]|uniref:HNH endonuclease n=1 Tax=Nocardioides cremeus TaxID=3058044 RepID=A0ABT8TQX0_9ACTN|nr:hypothetical protein [Nocardioides cremeus]MDO3394906.1 hypothetical protein [Nocardioides cremeus]
MSRLNLAGQIFGDLYVLSEAEPVYNADGSRVSRWLVSCLDCADSITIVRQSDLRAGRTTRCCACGKKAAGRSHWKGDVIGYKGAHMRARAVRSPASERQCSHRACDRPAREWAYTHDCPAEAVDDKGRRYCTCDDAKHFVALCRRHHIPFDNERAEIAPKGVPSLIHVAFGHMRETTVA